MTNKPEPDDDTRLAVYSFGHRHHDRPPTADITLDIRDWFRDPHTDPRLRGLTGRDSAVIDKVLASPGVPQFLTGGPPPRHHQTRPVPRHRLTPRPHRPGTSPAGPVHPTTRSPT